MTPSEADTHVSGIAALAEPLRRALYRFVVAQPGPVSRDQAAAGLGVPRHVAKFHLDRLEQDGLLAAEFSRPPGRGGPGAGRPAKLYRRSGREFTVSIPGRRYDLPARIMAAAITNARERGIPLDEALRESAAGLGRALGAQTAAGHQGPGSSGEPLESIREAVDDAGYEPRMAGDTLTLGNCPFHALAQDYTGLICGINLDFLRGLLEGLGAEGVDARLDPAPGRCCVTIVTGG